MQFIYHANAKEDCLEVENELYKYLFKVRRHKVGDLISFRNLQDHHLYTYSVTVVSKKTASLTLQNSEQKRVTAHKDLHLGWCVVDTKTIEKQLPYLNELGVASIDFIYADYSQKNIKLNIDKYNKILINSSQQCGRSSLIQFNVYNSLDEYLKTYPNAHAFNFSSTMIDEVASEINRVVVGCEGGFTKRELDLFEEDKIVGIDSSLILRSETAVSTVAAKLIV